MRRCGRSLKRIHNISSKVIRMATTIVAGVSHSNCPGGPLVHGRSQDNRRFDLLMVACRRLLRCTEKSRVARAGTVFNKIDWRNQRLCHMSKYCIGTRLIDHEAIGSRMLLP